MKIVVTGGAGFIGKAVAARLIAMGHRVRIADRVESEDSGAEHWTGELCEATALDAAVPAGTEVLIHLAAATSVLGSVRQPAAVYRNNVALTANLLEHCRTIGVPQFIFCSSNAVVGDVGMQTIGEGTPLRPLTPYGATKAAGEMLVSAYAASYGMVGTVLRLTNVYGPGMHTKDTFIARLMRAAITGSPIALYGNGDQVRDYVYIDDVAEAFAMAVREPWDGPLVIGSGVSISVNALHRMASQVSGFPIPTCRVEAPHGEMPAVRVDIRRARDLGYAPKVSLTEGLAATWESFCRWEAAQSAADI